MPPYDHPAVSGLFFSAEGGATLPRTPQERGVDVELPDGSVVGALYANRVPGGPVLFLLHAGTETISDDFSLWPEWAATVGANLFEIDYPGCGASPGRASLSRAREAARAALRYLVERPSDEVPAVVVLGRGVGAALAVDAVCRVDHSRIKGLILETPVADLSEVVERAGLDWSQGPQREATLKALAREWDLRKILTDWAGPLLVLHPNLAPTFPVAHGELLAQWGGGELVILDRGDRDDVPRLNEVEYRRALHDFVHAHAPSSEAEGQGRATRRLD